jgi:N-acyl-D-amino-acid deacylase
MLETAPMTIPLRLLLLCLFGFLAACAHRAGSPAQEAEPAAPYDLLIRNARVVDGTGNPWCYADVAVTGDRIVRVEAGIEGEARQVIDAQNRILSPGFIDVHGHAENVYEKSSERFVRMGVTSLITGNCGSSVTAVDSFLNQVNQTAIPLNIATLIGHNSVRRHVMQEVNRSPTSEELRQMEALVEKAMQDGAVGFSTGLIYVPGTYATTDEVIALAKAAAKHGGIYASHIRSEETGVLAAIQEALRVGKEAQMPVEISHFKISSQKLWGNSDQTLALVREARRNGLQVTVDQYAYTASSTRLSSNLMPSWALAGGFDEARRRILQPDTLKKIMQAMKQDLQQNGREDYTFAVVANYQPDSTFNGKTIPQITRQAKGNARLESQIRQLLDMYLAGDAQMVYHSMNESDVERIMREPFTMFASDAGPGNFGAGVPHPRGYGNNARVLARYVREKELISLEDAIRKMTSLPALTFGLKDRGLVREGYVADLLLINEDTVADLATFEKPHQYATGFDYVIVNGKPVLAEGKSTGELPGRAIRKSKKEGRQVPVTGSR